MTEEILETTEEPRVYEIPAYSMERLHHEVAKLNKRAAKLGCEALEVKVHGEVLRVDPNFISRWYNPDQPHRPIPHDAPKITMKQISIEGDAPKLAGYTFVGTLDHVTLPGSVVVKTVPGQTVPQEFYEHDAYCEHCNRIRRRNETFVLHHDEDDKHVQVGRQCLKDFLGHDPNAIARHLAAVFRLIASFEDEEDDRWFGGGGGRMEYTFPHDRVLELTSAVIRKRGWTPRSSADAMEGRPATADDVAYILSPPWSAAEREAHKKFVDSLDINERDHEEAIAAMKWLEEQESNNEYMHNLHAIAKAPGVPMSMFGFWCSLVAAYQRAQERLRLNEAQRKLNEYVGEIKERRDFTVKIMGIRYIEGAYGTIKLHRMLDDEGHTLIWFANTTTEMVEGGKYKIKGTVKKHDEYKNWKQTTLSRVKMLEEVESEEG